MANKQRNLLLSAATIYLASSMSFSQECLAQSRALPKTGFGNYTGNQLSPGAGVSLQGGGYRPKNAAPEVYNPGEPTVGHKLVRWEARFMPLKVWISPGKKLPEEAIQTINAQRPQEVYNLLNGNRAAIDGLARCMAWSPEMNQAAAAGIEQWRPFQTEGLFSFQFVDDPSQANILLFWADRLTGDESAGGISTAGNTVAVLYDANQVHQAEAQLNKPVHGTPVIIEVVANPEYEKLQARVAHEFGHALGIKEHSPYNDDLMCVNGIAKTLSPADVATIRWLYHQKPQLLMLPARYSNAPAVVQQPQPSEMPDSTQAENPANRNNYRIRSGGAGSQSPDEEQPSEQPYRRAASTGSDPSGSRGSSRTVIDDKEKKKDRSDDEKPKKEKKAKRDKDEPEQPDVPMPSFMKEQLQEQQRLQAEQEREQARKPKDKKGRKQPAETEQATDEAPPPPDRPSEGY